jgi:hypothetical protein
MSLIIVKSRRATCRGFFVFLVLFGGDVSLRLDFDYFCGRSTSLDGRVYLTREMAMGHLGVVCVLSIYLLYVGVRIIQYKRAELRMRPRPREAEWNIDDCVVVWMVGLKGHGGQGCATVVRAIPWTVDGVEIGPMGDCFGKRNAIR